MGHCLHPLRRTTSHTGPRLASPPLRKTNSMVSDIPAHDRADARQLSYPVAGEHRLAPTPPRHMPMPDTCGQLPTHTRPRHRPHPHGQHQRPPAGSTDRPDPCGGKPTLKRQHMEEGHAKARCTTKPREKVPTEPILKRVGHRHLAAGLCQHPRQCPYLTARPHR